MKVIDLLSDLSKYAINIKNKRIRYFDKNNDYYDECPLKEQEIIYRLYYDNIRLNDEVEIIEDTQKEDKKMEKMEFCYEVADKMQNANNERFRDFINEIIDKVNGE